MCCGRTNLFVGIFDFGGVGKIGDKCTFDGSFLYLYLASKCFVVGIFDFGDVITMDDKCKFD